MRWIILTLLLFNAASFCWLVLRPQPLPAALASPLPAGVPGIVLAAESKVLDALPEAPLLAPGASHSDGLCWYIGLESDFDARGEYDADDARRTLAYVLERMRAIALDARPVQIDVAGPVQHWVRVADPGRSPPQLLKQLLADGFDVYLATASTPEGVVAGPFGTAIRADQEVDILNAAGWQARRQSVEPYQRQHWLRLASRDRDDPVPAAWWSDTTQEWPTLVKRRYYCAGIAQTGELE